MARRRVLTLAAAAVVAAVALGVAPSLGGGGDREGPRGALSRRLEHSPEPNSFGFRYAASGTRILDCVRANRRFVGIVVRAQNLLVLSDPDADAFAVVTESAVLLHRSLFRDVPLPAKWIRVGRDASASDKELLADVIGPDVASYVFADGLPPTGAETARAAIEVASDVTALGRRAVAGTSATGFRVIVDADQFAAETGQPDTSRQAAPPEVPIIDVWLDERDVVVQVAVRAAADDHAVDDATGWVLEYTGVPSGALPDDVADAVDLSSVDVSALMPAAVGCNVPM